MDLLRRSECWITGQLIFLPFSLPHDQSHRFHYVLKIYVADLKEVESLPRHEVMHHLESIDSNVCAAYLEHIIIGLDETGAEFHEKLIELYLADIKPDQEKVARSNTSGSTASNCKPNYTDYFCLCLVLIECLYSSIELS